MLAEPTAPVYFGAAEIARPLPAHAEPRSSSPIASSEPPPVVDGGRSRAPTNAHFPAAAPENRALIASARHWVDEAISASLRARSCLPLDDARRRDCEGALQLLERAHAALAPTHDSIADAVRAFAEGR